MIFSSNPSPDRPGAPWRADGAASGAGSALCGACDAALPRVGLVGVPAARQLRLVSEKSGGEKMAGFSGLKTS